MAAFEKELGVTILQAWGMTETSPLGSVARPPRGMTGDEAWKYRDTQGRLFCTVEGRLVGDDGTVLPNDGVAVGEVQVRGPWITGSYYKDDDPAKFDHGWLRTGDVGTIDRLGYVTLTDRAKDVIKSGGEWISSMELENRLMAHPDVSEAAVIGVPDEKWGERPLAAVVVQPGRHRDPGGIARVPGRPRPALAAPGAVGVHRRGAEDQRRQVRQDQDAGRLRPRRLQGGHGRESGALSSRATALACGAAGRYADPDRLVGEASPSPVYGAALLMRLGFIALPGFKSPSLRSSRPPPGTYGEGA